MAEASARTLCIVPAFNEEESVTHVVADIRAALPSADVLVVDDGSTDRTAERAEAAGAMVCRLPYNVGIGGAVQTGLKFAAEAGYGVAVQVDGDGQHPAEEIAKLLEALDTDPEADLVVGSRFLGDPDYKAPPLRRAGIRILARVLSLLCRRRLTDTTSGFRAVRGEAIELLARSYPRDYPEVESIVLLHRARYTVREVPVRMRERQGGASSITLFHAPYYMIKVLLATLVEMVKRPKGKKGHDDVPTRPPLD